MPASAAPARALDGLRVVEFTHMVMGPTRGVVLADMGADVVKVEPIEGDRTRHLLGAGAGFFPMFNRNKKSIAIDLSSGRREDRPRALWHHGCGGGKLQTRHHGQVRPRLRQPLDRKPRAGQMARATLAPITMDGQRLGVRLHPPRMGEHTDEVLRGLGYADGDIASLRARHVVA